MSSGINLVASRKLPGPALRAYHLADATKETIEIATAKVQPTSVNKKQWNRIWISTSMMDNVDIEFPNPIH